MTAARPWTPRRRLAAVAILYALSVSGWIALVASRPGTYWQQTDAIVYRQAGLAVRQTGALYEHTFGPAGLPFTYPPLVAVAFAALSVLSFAAWQVLLATAGQICLVLSSRAAVTMALTPAVDRTSGWAAAFAVAAIGVWLEPVDLTLHFGQINLIVMALVLVDLAAPGTSRVKGVGVGLAAGLKLTPLIFIGYLLVTRRARPALTALATFGATVAIGFAALPSDSLAYWSGRFLQPGDQPSRLVNQSLYGLALRLWHGGGAARPAWLAAAALVAAVGLVAAAAADRRGSRLLGVSLCAATGLLISPISWTHHWVYVAMTPALAVPALRDVVARRAGRALPAALASGEFLALVAWWPLPVGQHGGLAPVALHPAGLLRLAPHDNGAELRWNAWQLIYGDAYVLAALAFLAGVAAWLAVTRRRATLPGRAADGHAAGGSVAALPTTSAASGST